MPDTPLLSPGDSLLIAAPVEWREACLSVPALRAIQRMGVEVEILCPERQVGFWQVTGFDGNCHGDRASARDIAGIVKGRQTALLWEAGPAADGFAKAGIPRRIGPDIKSLAKRLTEPVALDNPAGPVTHRVRFYLNLASALGAEPMMAENFAPLQMDVPLAVERVLLVPDSDFGPHYEWPLDRWEAVAKALLGKGRQLRIANGTKGAALAKAIPEAEAVTLATPALEDLASCSLCVAADGSVSHLAAHVGTACVVLFGPGEPEWMRPLGRQHVTVRRKVECSPCHAPKCRMDLRCQHDLDVEEVLRVLP
ncbi:glycosyltransferase family 9 protein [Luteolibacter flavescens]|uniref:Glycosyltransferase family 9 protein n=1 Tax=Luteolibacter flavescens TaxID=1859460 RepID=A0ABT3FK45_9BACT|nr:glycosyltransferase family 9 protein [Luteolibacter flavescens]MCW1883910.1 glycosyltransferase family 9 protein [Luteolibacter flavescens]